jgi:hypothetical protein
MANAFDTYTPTGPADAGRVRTAALIDLAIGALLAILVWPFPVMRIVTTDITGSVALGWVAHVALLLTFFAVMDVAYGSVATVLLRRTAGMYLQDIGFADTVAVTWGRALRWAFGWTAATLPAAFGAQVLADGETGWAARLSGLGLSSTRSA